MEFTVVENGGVCSPKGYRAAGVTAGLKPSGQPDLAMLVSDAPAVVAASFTSNLFAAAPVEWDRKIVRQETPVRAVVVNSGVANACTGVQGAQDAKVMASYAAEKLGIAAEEVLVSSTGVIGKMLPMDIIRHGIDLAVESLSTDANQKAARAIMTTDTAEKRIAVKMTIGGKEITIGAMTKGAGMIAPQMTLCTSHPRQATMLAYFTTDAAISRNALQDALGRALDNSFNRIVVDGDTSTNDTMVVMANGLAGNAEIHRESPELDEFAAALEYCAQYLAKAMVLDGEGVSKFVELRVFGAIDDASARQVAEAIARSPLCKTAWYGQDPNWGRILCAAGYSKVPFKPTQVDLDFDDVPIVRSGLAAPGTTDEEMAAVLKNRSFRVKLCIGQGPGRFVLWTCDLTHDYVKINADYHT
ncbi:MAG: bifunctional glutamate N-acetyltransferase/amino-acid acetyltransferase ArgJ [Lentisphaeria bacterium]|nr:bifunctional glutamate N-acetyltransferase/amino-acid acetyltransferase ArgJ [Lentisphaeria bacterium]